MLARADSHSGTYQVWQENNETDFSFTNDFISSKYQCYHHQNSTLGQLHTDGDVVLSFGSSHVTLPYPPPNVDVFLFPKLNNGLKEYNLGTLQNIQKRKTDMLKTISEIGRAHV